MQGHIQDVKNLFISDKSSDSFASHFASLIPEGTVKKNVKDFVKIKVDILWQGDPLSCLPTFGTRTCKLCAKERYAIIKLTRMTPHLAINKCNEVHGACRHRPRFHRFNHSENTNSSTDESVRTKESQRLSSSYHLCGKYKLHHYPRLVRQPQGGACAWTNQSSTYVLGKSFFQWATCPLPPYH
jgi:hypothetical protein